MNRTKEDIYQNEINPALYLKRAREIRLRRLEEIVGCTILVALLAVTFTIVQVGYGIW